MTARDLMPTRQGWMALGVVAALFVAFWFRGAALTPDPVRTANGAEQFDTGRALARLGRIIGDGRPHPVDSAALDAVRERLLQEVKALGYAPEVYAHTACRQLGYLVRCAQVRNVVFRAGPRQGKALVLTAHYDSVDDSPGAGDDGIGVAVWLEAANHFAKSPPSRPVVFLITDGEETALLGAQAFSDNASDYHIDIGRIINLEARGNRGPAMMFETSHPNDAVVGDWARGAARPASNSLMTAVYELLPNSTDLTIYLHDHHAGINMAVADGFAFYHTEKDDLAHLDPRSVQHMGDQALAAAKAYVASTATPHGDIAYADILTRLLVSLPGMPALVLLGLCLGLAAILMAKPTAAASLKVFDWRGFALAPLALLAASLAAWVLQILVGLLRPQPAFWTAYPQAFNAAIFLAAALAAVAGLSFLARRSTRAMLFATGWFWFLAIGVGLAFAVPGVVMIFLVPGIAFVAAAVVARIAPVVAPVAHTVAAIVALVMVLPLIQLFDIMMGLAIAPVFGLLCALALLPALCLIGPVQQRGMPLVLLGALPLLVALIVTLIVPAYSRATPLSLDIYAHYDADARTALAAASAPASALPADLHRALPDRPAPVLPGFTAEMAHAPLPFRPWHNARVEIASDATTADIRTVTLRLADQANVVTTDGGGEFRDAAPAESARAPNPASRFIRLRIPEAAHPIRLTYGPNGRAWPLTTAQNGYYVFDCFGRACDGAELKIELKPQPAGEKSPDWIVQGFITGLPDDAAPLARLRPDWAIQIGTGDATIVTRKFRLP